MSDHEFASQKTVPQVKAGHQRHFDNPFPDYTNQPLPDPTDYIEQALGLMQDIYSYYTLFPSRPRRDLYVGGSGVAYSCIRLAQRLPDENLDRRLILDLAQRIATAAIKEVSNETHHERAFIVGDSGVYVAAALVYAETKQQEDAEPVLWEFTKLTKNLEKLTFPGSSADELFKGRAGYLAGFLELWKKFPNHPTLLDVPVPAIVLAVIESGRQYSSVRGFSAQSPLMYFHFEAEYIGAAHGVSSILQVLLCFPGVLQTIPGALADIKASLDYLVANQRFNGNFSAVFGAVDEEKDELVQWCHGAGGVIYLLAKAYLVWKDDKYLEGCKRCAELIWSKGLLKKGPGLCHGIAGNAYAFLIMFRITERPEYLYRACCFADIMFERSVRELSRLPDNPYSLFEGIAGTMCFYADLTDAMKSSFPFYDIHFDCTETFSSSSVKKVSVAAKAFCDESSIK